MDFDRELQTNMRLLRWLQRTEYGRARVYRTHQGWRVFEPGQDYFDTQKVFATLPDAVTYARRVTR